MRILFLTVMGFDSFSERNIYTDLLREFIKDKHEVYCISPAERRTGQVTHFEENGHLLKLKVGNILKTNIIEKGISTLMIERQFVSAIKKYFSNIKFDLVLYSTPPITAASAVKYVKERDGAKTYLMLKDIFPQNAVDIDVMQKSGIKGFLYKYFRKKEKKLYALSDYIGCMSQANADYLLQHNPEIPKEKVGLCPNSIEVREVRLSVQERVAMRDKYGIPRDKKVFVYGGNLGKPQDVPFIIECLKKCSKLEQAYFVIAGSGTDRHYLDAYVERENPSHVKLLPQIPKNEFDQMLACVDVALLFLDHRFTIPNIPSRLLSYMQAGLPIYACTDDNTDVGRIITNGEFGWWSRSDSSDVFCERISMICNEELSQAAANSYNYLLKHYQASETCKRIEQAMI